MRFLKPSQKSWDSKYKEYQTEISQTKWNDKSQEVRADKNFILSVDASINPLKGLLKNE